jgi:hypothetical protein
MAAGCAQSHSKSFPRGIPSSSQAEALLAVHEIADERLGMNREP